MKFNRIIAAAAAALSLVSAVSCAGKGSGSQGGGFIPAPTDPVFEPVTVATGAPIVAADDGPRLYIKDTTAAPGELAEVVMAVENADRKWNMCGIHVTYPNVLACEMFDAESREIEYTKGDASEYSTGSVGMLWQDNLPEELVSNDLGCLFFTEVFNGDMGRSGDIVTFYLQIPEDAVSGTEYPIDFFYSDTDVFIDAAKDYSMQKYVFENWKGGKITVK